MMKTAILLGATGLVGSQCLGLLLENPAYSRVIALTRRPLTVSHPKLETKIIDFENLKKSAPEFSGDDLFYCMGTTLKQAGSREAFRHVDYDYSVEIAKLALVGNVSRWLMISSVGASAQSPYFYLRVKGEIEQEIGKLGFKETHFFRPSFLLGKRPGFRLLEEATIPIIRALAPLMMGPLKKYKPIEASAVAKWMIETAQRNTLGTSVHVT